MYNSILNDVLDGVGLPYYSRESLNPNNGKHDLHMPALGINTIQFNQ